MGGVSDADIAMQFDPHQLVDRNRRPSRISQDRAASVLVLTLVVVAMLTLGAAAFFERMFAEHRAARAAGRQLQARQLAESGVEYIAAVLAQEPVRIEESGGLFTNPQLFQAVLVADDPLAAFRGRFTVLAPDLTADGLFGGLRYGLENESARLNLNTVLLADRSGEGAARRMLMALPGMTESIADAILDWIDDDDQTRPLGAERDYYTSLDPPYEPRNGPLASIEELLMVRDVTPALLVGADLNRNAAIDGVEQPLTAIDNADNSIGLLNRGWTAYLTLDSAETNLRSDGKPKINVNQDDLRELHKELVDVLGADMAKFIIAFRQGGPYEGNATGQPASGIQLDFKQPGRFQLLSVLDLVGARTNLPAPNERDGNENQNERNGNAENENGNSGRNDGSRGDRRARRGEEGQNIVQAAFAEDTAAMQTYLAKLLDNLTVHDQPTIPGRLNVNQAPRRLLTGVPGLNPTDIDRIIANRDVTLGQLRPEQAHETWLLTEGIVDLDKMKRLLGLVTTGGNVYRAQVVGFYDAEGPADRIEVVIDATQSPAVVRRRWDLRELGPGYSPETLGATPQDAR